MTTNGLFWESCLFDVPKVIEETAGQAGLLLMKTLIDEEVAQFTGAGYTYQSDRQVRHFARLLSFGAL